MRQGRFCMEEFEGKRWKDLCDVDKKELLKKAVCRDFRVGCPLTNGEGLVEFSETLAVLGSVCDGVISVDDDEILYNPCIGEGGKPLSQEQLDEMFDDYVASVSDVSDGIVYKFEKICKNRPHVVLLGAGASVAAIPNGDKSGKRISAMSGFIKNLGLEWIINEIDLQTSSDNLEDIYMEIYGRADCAVQRIQLENAIEQYFCDFELPDEPTVYDYLLLSLTNKDLVATFNWDPLLAQAYIRCEKITNNLPQLAFLHGNVAIATCEEDMVIGTPYNSCPRCGKILSKVPLLYPIREKNYHSNPYISSSWRQLEQYLQKAYRLTIFGYSAPKSDQAAINMLKNAWGKVEDRNLEEIEIIDIRPEEEVKESWTDFIHTHHYSVYGDIFDSALGKFPRRTCEVLFDNTQNICWMHGDKGFKKNMGFDELEKYLANLLEDEKSGTDILIDPYVCRNKKW